MMTNREARNRAGWIAALAGALVLTPALLLALPAPRPVGVAGVKAMLDGWVGEEGGVAGGAVAAAPPLARMPEDTAILQIARVVPVTHADTVPARSTFAYEVAALQKAPELRNESEVRSMLSRFYPRMLEDAGIGGTTMMQFVIRADGTVDPTSIRVIKTTHEQFAEPSTLVVEKFKFEPGIYNGKPVRVLLQMPITWAPSEPQPARVGDDEAVGQARSALRESHISTPALLAIREIITQRHREFLGSATGQSKVLLVVVHPDARIEHTTLSDGSMDPYTLRHSNLAPGVSGDQIDRVDVMTSTDLATVAKDLNAVIWVTLKS
jgi:TonB family protein